MNAERILSQCSPTNGGCMEWLGKKLDGYGYVVIGTKKLGMVHRIVYEHAKGAIPNGLNIDHLCRNRACCNPLHLEAVTQRENVMRGDGLAAINAAKTHCKRGHEYTPENTFYRYDPNPRRDCRECRRILKRLRAA